MMKFRLVNKQAFTILEMLFVLMVVSIIIFIMSFSFQFFNKFILNQEIDKLTAHLTVSQSQAILQNEEIEFKLYPDGYDIKQQEEVYSYRFNGCTQLTNNFPNNTLVINENGNINRAGTITFHCNDYQKDLVLQLGGGRYYVK